MSSSWIIPGFQHVKLLGRGTFAKVNLYIHEHTGEEVAIKTILRSKYEELNLEYPPRELSIIKKLHHPSVVQVYEIIEEEDKIHIVMEYIDGETLADAIPDAGFSESTTRAIFRDLLLAVEYMHSQGIVHRDLKLENVILKKAPRKRSSSSSSQNQYQQNTINCSGTYYSIKLIDFGLSNTFKETDLLSTFCGTPQYAAPELLQGEKYTAPPVDVWSLGVLLYTIRTAKFPFANPLETIACKLPDDPPLSAGMRDFLSMVFINDPKERMTLAKMIRHPWVNIGYDVIPYQPVYSNELNPEIVKLIESVNILTTPRGPRPSVISPISSTSTSSISTSSNTPTSTPTGPLSTPAPIMISGRYDSFEQFIMEYNSFTTLYYMLQKKLDRLKHQPDLSRSLDTTIFSYRVLDSSLRNGNLDDFKKMKKQNSCIIS